MKRVGKFVRITWLLTAVAILGSCGAACAQDGPPPDPPRGHHHGFGPGDDMMRFVAVEAGLGGKTVTGSPFTATFSSTEAQTLSDGNQINRSSSGTIARDSQGRTRRDMTLPNIGRFNASGQSTPPHVILINDVVAGAQYVLQPDRKVAHKEMRQRKMGRQGGAPPDDESANTNRPNVTTASLGTQTISGVQAEGTRTTRTIPAGAVGNEKPIVITVERWYSPELQTVVMIKRSDPYVGQSEFQLTNIQRQEPDASLFQVPSDYTVRTGGRDGKHPGRRGGPGVPPSDNGGAEPTPQD